MRTTGASMLSREARLVLLSAGSAPDEAFLSLLDGRVDWGLVVGLATQQRAAIELARRLAALPPGTVPTDVTAALRRVAMVDDFRQMVLRQRLEESVRVLSAAGIRVLALKGAALALTAYRSFGERPMGDLDLLVGRDDARRAQALLLENGWRVVGGSPESGFYGGHHHLPPLEDARGSGAAVELHTDLFFAGHPFRFGAEEVWAGARPAPLGDGEVLAPSPQHALLHLCIHFAWSHMARQGTWRAFRDLRALRESGEVDWDEAAAMAREARAGTCCFWTLRLARDLAGVEIPERTLHRLGRPVPAPLLGPVARHLEMGLLPANVPCPSVRLSQLMWTVAFRPGRSGHGTTRPWERGEAAAELFQSEVPVHGVGKLRAHLRSLPQWRRYLASLVLPAPSSPQR